MFLMNVAAMPEVEANGHKGGQAAEVQFDKQNRRRLEQPEPIETAPSLASDARMMC